LTPPPRAGRPGGEPTCCEQPIRAEKTARRKDGEKDPGPTIPTGAKGKGWVSQKRERYVILGKIQVWAKRQRKDRDWPVPWQPLLQRHLWGKS